MFTLGSEYRGVLKKFIKHFRQSRKGRPHETFLDYKGPVSVCIYDWGGNNAIEVEGTACKDFEEEFVRFAGSLADQALKDILEFDKEEE